MGRSNDLPDSDNQEIAGVTRTEDKREVIPQEVENRQTASREDNLDSGPVTDQVETEGLEREI